MNVLAISTFNADGLALYGRRMMDAWAAHWPLECRLRVYTEQWKSDVPAGIELLDLDEAAPWLADFKARHAHRQPIDYRWDARRFAHKVAAICHAAQEPGIDLLIWLDGDTVTHAPVTVVDLVGLAPRGEEWIAWLDRAHSYPECGFLMFNTAHPEHTRLIEALRRMYVDDMLFALPEWHDSFVLQHVVKVAAVATRSLSGNAQGHPHPMINGPLGAWFDHMKGPTRKQHGRSRRGDLATPRPEEYWR